MANPSRPAYCTTYSKLETAKAKARGRTAQINFSNSRNNLTYRLLSSVLSRPVIMIYILLAMVALLSGYAEITSREGKRMM